MPSHHPIYIRVEFDLITDDDDDEKEEQEEEEDVDHRFKIAAYKNTIARIQLKISIRVSAGVLSDFSVST